MSPSRNRFGLREARVHFGTFDFSFICVVGELDAAARFAAWKFDDPEVEGLVGLSNAGYEPRGKRFYRLGHVPIIWLPRVPRTAREHGTLAHEVFHVVADLMDWASIPLAEQSSEVFCHALGHGVTSVLEQLSVRDKSPRAARIRGES